MLKRKFFFKLGFDIIAIIIGISASFWISEMSIEREEENQRERVLNRILIESDDIKNYCDERKTLRLGGLKLTYHLKQPLC